MNKDYFNFPRVFPSQIIGGIIIGFFTIYIVPSLIGQIRFFLTTWDLRTLVSIAIGCFALYGAYLYTYAFTFNEIHVYKRYEKVFRKYNINNGRDFINILDNEYGRDHNYQYLQGDFKSMVKRGYVSSEIYNLIPSLRPGGKFEDDMPTSSSSQFSSSNGYSDATVDELERLAYLYKNSLISEAEFKELKNRLLNK